MLQNRYSTTRDINVQISSRRMTLPATLADDWCDCSKDRSSHLMYCITTIVVCMILSGVLITLGYMFFEKRTNMQMFKLAMSKDPLTPTGHDNSNEVCGNSLHQRNINFERACNTSKGLDKVVRTPAHIPTKRTDTEREMSGTHRTSIKKPLFSDRTW